MTIDSRRVTASVVVTMSLFLKIFTTGASARRMSTMNVRNHHSCAAFVRPTRSYHEAISIQMIPSSSDKNESANRAEIAPTWTYTPYEPKSRTTTHQRRHFSSSSSWKVPNSISIPQDKIEISFQRSSGAGGQNVNKVNTKVDLRFRLDEADWIPAEVRDRLAQQQANRINAEGYLSVQSQEFRTQSQNRKAALSKLSDMILQAYPRPKERKMRKGISKASKERNKEDKRKRSQVKANRKRVDF